MSATEVARLTPKAGTYAWLDGWLGGEKKRKLSEHTWARKENGAIIVKLYDTDIYAITDHDEIVLRNGGFKTTTTKNHINVLLPLGIQVFQRNGIWLVGNEERAHVFYDGIVLDQEGRKI